MPRNDSINQAERFLRERGNVQRAEKEQAYLKSPNPMFGCGVPAVRKAASQLLRRNPDITEPELLAIIETFWAHSIHEMKSVAIILCQYGNDRFSREALPTLESLLAEVTGWDHCDWLAIHSIGPLLERHPRIRTRLLRRWSQHESHWVRRSSLHSQILAFRDGCGDLPLFDALARRLVSETEFFIQKGLGWTLRELVPHHPEYVTDFVRDCLDVMGQVAFHEATRKLPPETAQPLRDRRVAHRRMAQRNTGNKNSPKSAPRKTPVS